MWKTIERDELWRRLQGAPGTVLLLDVRERQDYEDEHIKDAISVPLSELSMRAQKSFDPEREIIVYCGRLECQASVKAAKILAQKGFERLLEYEGGLTDWKEAGYPTEGKRGEAVKAA